MSENFDYSRDALQKLPHDRLVLRDKISERVWVRVLPGGLLILDNVPVLDKYRPHDVVTPGGKIIHRRWVSAIGFYYKAPGANELERARLREALFNLTTPLGELAFCTAQMGQLFSTAATEEDITKARSALVEALKSLDMFIGEEHVEPVESILAPDLSRFA